MFVTSDHFREQLREVAAAVPLGEAGVLCRCLDCNLTLARLPREQVRDRVPPFVWETAEQFLTCRRCHRIYWPATHRAHVLRELAALGLSDAAESRP